MKKLITALMIALLGLSTLSSAETYKIAGTNQTKSFNNTTITSLQKSTDKFYGQNANYPGNTPSYTDNGNGTISDNVTGLMWQQSFDHNNDGKVNVSDKLTYKEITNKFGDGKTSFAGYNDWRIPTIKEMYSLIQFSGRDISPESKSSENLTPFIDNKTFEFAYGDLSSGERLIDMQCASTNIYVSQEVPKTVFGVNFADGRIKGYGMDMPGRGDKAFNYLLVRGNTEYGINDFKDNSNGTITDKATSLMWMQDDSNSSMKWAEALEYAEGKEYAGYSDWRLPDAKELQSIVDYTRSPATTNSGAIDPLFNCSNITNEAGEADFPWYWTSTTHANSGRNAGSAAVYVSFGKSLGNMPQMPTRQMRPDENGNQNNQKGHRPPMHNNNSNDNSIKSNSNNSKTINWTDVHGAGSQRSDPKIGNPSDYTTGHGPQGDAIRINNYVRLVRNIK